MVLLRHTLPSETPHHCNCSFYVDEILSRLEFGLRLGLYSYDHLFALKDAGKLDGLSNVYEKQDLVMRCVKDSVAWTVL